MQVLVFEVFGDYGHFRKFFTTSSPLSFAFPPPTSVYGMLGAIIGIQKEENPKVFSYENCKVAVGLCNSVQKVRMGINHINTKGKNWVPIEKNKHKPRTQVRFEFVKSPHYRIYVWHSDEKVFDELCENLKKHKTVYTLCLGISELLADFRFCGIYEASEKQASDDFIEVRTILPVERVTKIKLDTDLKYLKDRVPVFMTENREVKIYKDVIFEANSKAVLAMLKERWELGNGEKIVFI